MFLISWLREPCQAMGQGRAQTICNFKRSRLHLGSSPCPRGPNILHSKDPLQSKDPLHHFRQLPYRWYLCGPVILPFSGPRLCFFFPLCERTASIFERSPYSSNVIQFCVATLWIGVCYPGNSMRAVSVSTNADNPD